MSRITRRWGRLPRASRVAFGLLAGLAVGIAYSLAWIDSAASGCDSFGCLGYVPLAAGIALAYALIGGFAVDAWRSPTKCGAILVAAFSAVALVAPRAFLPYLHRVADIGGWIGPALGLLAMTATWLAVFFAPRGFAAIKRRRRLNR